jgi:hypothetical protein
VVDVVDVDDVEDAGGPVVVVDEGGGGGGSVGTTGSFCEGLSGQRPDGPAQNGEAVAAAGSWSSATSVP